MAENHSQKYGTGVHKLKIGKSFDKKSGGNSVYHSIRYDFKPVSVDEEQLGILEVKEQHSVSVALPHVDGSGQTNYKGNVKPANNKECILIIDHETGEFTLERLDSQIMLKKTRAAKLEKPVNSYEVREKPEKPVMPTTNSYEVRDKPINPYQVSDKPVMPPLQQRQKKRSPAQTNGMTFKDSLPDMSPLHSNKSSPAWSAGSARASPNGVKKAAEVDMLGRPKGELSDSSSDSGSSSGSDSDSAPEENHSAPKPESLATAGILSMPGDLTGLSMPGDLSVPDMDTGRNRQDTDTRRNRQDIDTSRHRQGVTAKSRPEPKPKPVEPEIDPTARKSRSIQRPPTSRSQPASRMSLPDPTARTTSRPTPPGGRPTPSSRHTPSSRPTPPSKPTPPSRPTPPTRPSSSQPSSSVPSLSNSLSNAGSQLSMPNFLGDDLHLSDSDD